MGSFGNVNPTSLNAKFYHVVTRQWGNFFWDNVKCRLPKSCLCTDPSGLIMRSQTGKCSAYPEPRKNWPTPSLLMIPAHLFTPQLISTGQGFSFPKLCSKGIACTICLGLSGSPPLLTTVAGGSSNLLNPVCSLKLSTWKYFFHLNQETWLLLTLNSASKT